MIHLPIFVVIHGTTNVPFFLNFKNWVMTQYYYVYSCKYFLWEPVRSVLQFLSFKITKILKTCKYPSLSFYVPLGAVLQISGGISYQRRRRRSRWPLRSVWPGLWPQDVTGSLEVAWPTLWPQSPRWPLWSVWPTLWPQKVTGPLEFSVTYFDPKVTVTFVVGLT